MNDIIAEKPAVFKPDVSPSTNKSRPKTLICLHPDNHTVDEIFVAADEVRMVHADDLGFSDPSSGGSRVYLKGSYAGSGYGFRLRPQDGFAVREKPAEIEAAINGAA
jgi:hypothetical protein